jgi:hypothetical protein
MSIHEVFSNKEYKAKDHSVILSTQLSNGQITINEILDYAATAKDAAKGSCIEAIELATKQEPAIANKSCFDFVTENLDAKAPRIKWESAKVIGNIAPLFEKQLDKAIGKLIVNTEDDGTVVRWSAAYALSEIIKLNTKRNKDLIPAIEAIMDREEKNSIKKIYQQALKKVK